MGVVLILLGLAAAGVVVDFVVENGLGSGPDLTFQLFGGTFTWSSTQTILAAAVLAALAIVFLVVGFGLARGSWGRRRGLRRRVRYLEHENATLRSRAHLAEIVRVEPVEDEPPSAPPVATGPSEVDRTVRTDERPDPATRR